nr:hypothetical protein OH826_18335 [Streptomyces sp. NBC_00899]
MVKGLSTAMGEATSDYLVGAMAPPIAVVLGFAAFLAALGVPYTVSSIVCALVLLTVFATWRSTEKTLSMHSIDTAGAD